MNLRMHLFANSVFLTVGVLVATGMVILWLLLRSYWHFSRRKGSSATVVQTPRASADRKTLPHDAPNDVARWQVAMHETARELSAQLDSKMSALQALIAEADRAAARLEAAKGRSSVEQTDTAEDGPDMSGSSQNRCEM